MDGSNENLAINLHKEIILHENVADLFEKYKVSKSDLDIFSEDTDYADYWIVEKVMLNGYRPKIVVHEINQQPSHKFVPGFMLNSKIIID